MEKLTWLLPKFGGFFSQPFEEQLSASFIAVLLIISIGFLSKSLFSFLRASARVGWFNKNLKEISTKNIAAKRIDLRFAAQNESKVDSVGHLWLEFDETLIEIREDGVTQLFNTFDAVYFFNSSTLAKGVTNNRLIAAVPGFLTAIGVIGTFVGLQIGLSGMDISADVTIEEMKAGVAAVIGGAKVAFMTSVWGVLLSVVFNFIEKLLEETIHRKIDSLQNKIDEIFPRLSPESQLQVIAENSSESRESLQGLAEQIGVKLQESMHEVTKGISEALTPVIDKFVNETSEGNQKALEDLLTKFMDGFGAQGSKQRVAMESASEKVNNSIAGMSNTMEVFIRKMESSQQASNEREKELISSISLQVSQLVEQSNEQGRKMTELMGAQLGSINNTFEESQNKAAMREKELTSNIDEQIKSLTEGISAQSNVLTEFVSKQVSSLNETFETRESKAAQRAEQRDVALAEQTNAISTSTEHLVSKIESSIQNHQSSSEKVLRQGQALQQSVESSVLASAKATNSMRESASELKSAADSMHIFSSHVKDAGNKLSGAVTEAVETTKDLANQNQQSSERMESLRDQLLEDTAKFKDIADQINNMILNAGNTFDNLKSSQADYLQDLKRNVSELSTQMAGLLSDYAEQANSQTAEHLKVWSNSSTTYAVQMNNAAQALSSVVDEIQDKVGE